MTAKKKTRPKAATLIEGLREAGMIPPRRFVKKIDVLPALFLRKKANR